MNTSKLVSILFRKKPVLDESDNLGLKRCLSAFDLTLMGIGAIIGTGIFVLTGVASATASGPAVVLSYIVAGVACAFAALAYAELAASVGGSGSAYGYSYAAFGELIAWIIGWDLILEYGVSVAAVANGWSGYFNNALQAIGLGLPYSLTHGPFATDPITHVAAPGYINLPSFGIIFILMMLLVSGVKESSRLNTAMVFVKLFAIIVFLSVALFHIHPENWHPFVPFGWFSVGESGTPIGVFAGASIVFFAYVGFDAVSTAAEEANNPQRDLPIGTIAALAFCTVVYIVVSATLTGIVSYKELNVSSPVSFALQRIGYDWASGWVAAGVTAGLTAVMLVLYYALTRILAAMSRDGLVNALFAKVSPRTKVPAKNTIICGLVIAIMAGYTPLGILAELVNIGTLAAFILVCVGVIVLRFTHPDLPRPFKMPYGILMSICGVLSCSALIYFLPLTTQLRFLVWLAVGLIIYFAYGIRHSRLNKK